MTTRKILQTKANLEDFLEQNKNDAEPAARIGIITSVVAGTLGALTFVVPLEDTQLNVIRLAIILVSPAIASFIIRNKVWSSKTVAYFMWLNSIGNPTNSKDIIE